MVRTSWSRLVLTLLTGVAAWSLAVVLARGLAPALTAQVLAGRPRALAVGACVMFGALAVLVARRLAAGATTFWLTLDHEATHALATVLTGGRPRALSVHEDGSGRCAHQGSHASWLVALAPYVLPTATVGLLALGLLVPRPWSPWFVGTIAVSLGYHAASDAIETRPWQPDLRAHGGWLAIGTVVGAWTCTALTVLGSLVLGPGRVAAALPRWPWAG